MLRFTITQTLVALLLAITSMPSLAKPSKLEDAVQLFDAKHFQQAKAAFMQLQQQEPNSAWYYLGRIHYQQNDFEAALEYFEQTLALAPNHADEYYWLALTNAELIQDAFFLAKPSYASAIEDNFLQAIKHDPNHLGAHTGLFYFYLSAPAIAGGSSAKAWQQVQQVATINSHEGALLTLHYHNEESGDKAFRQYIEDQLANTTVSDEWLFKAGLALQQRQQYNLAKHCFTQAQSAQGNLVRGHYGIASLYQLGRTAVLSKRFIEIGIAALEQYLTETLEAAHPPKSWAKYRLSQLYRLDKNEQASQRLLNQLAQANITDPELKALLER